MLRGVSTVAAMALAVAGSVALAKEQHWTATPEGYAAHLSGVGAWEFSAMRKGADGKPECTEAWTFNKDGTGTVISGEQELNLSWKYVQHDVLGMLLKITYESSTAGKDCLGRDTDPSRYPLDNGAGLTLMFFNSGRSAYVCSAPQVVVDENGEYRLGPNGKVMTMQSLENCWGNLAPVSDS